MEPVIWLAIFSTLIAISTFTTGLLWHLRTVNFHQYVTHYMNFYSHHKEEPQDTRNVASEYLALSDSYKHSAENAFISSALALLSTLLLGVGWLSTVLCFVKLERVCECFLISSLILSSIAVLLLIISILNVAIYHRKYLFKTPELSNNINEAICEHKKNKK